MRCNLARRELASVLVGIGIALHAGAVHAVGLSISSANVAKEGDGTQLCVSLSTGGVEVAGTQNDLVWDGTCMTLNEGACGAAGGHGKQVQSRIQNSADFRMRVLVLSLSDVDPIDDGVLYCCAVQGEAPAGSCCAISVVNTGASDSKGNAVGGVGGNTGRLCTQGGSGGGGGGGSVNPPRSQMNQNLGDGGGAVGDSGGGAVAGSGGGSGAQAPPANQVLQGGGAPAAAPANQGAAAPVIAEPGAPAGQAPTPAAGSNANLPPVQAVPVTPGAEPPPPAVAPATLAATAAVAAPTAAAVPPTAVATAVVEKPTAVPPTKAPASTPSAPPAAAAAKSGGGGWFGCQIDAQASAAPVLALALLLAALAHVARRSHR